METASEPHSDKVTAQISDCCPSLNSETKTPSNLVGSLLGLTFRAWLWIIMWRTASRIFEAG